MEDRLGTSDNSPEAKDVQKITDQTVDQCACGAVQGLWWLQDHPYPMRNRHLFGAHAPVGCFRQGGSFNEVQLLHRKITGLNSYTWTERQIYQSLMTRLSELPSETVEKLGVVVTTTPLHSPVPYVEITSPLRLPVVGSVPIPPQKILVNGEVLAKDEVTGRIKPPWIK